MISNPVLPSPAAGATGNPGVTFLQNSIPAAITLILIVGAVIFLFVLLIGAVQWIMSGGDKSAVEAARGKISNAIVGLVILFAVFAIIELLNIFFNIQLFELNLPNLVGTYHAPDPSPCIAKPGQPCPY